MARYGTNSTPPLYGGGEYLAHKHVVAPVKDNGTVVVLQVRLYVLFPLKLVKCGMLNLHGGSICLISSVKGDLLVVVTSH